MWSAASNRRPLAGHEPAPSARGTSSSWRLRWHFVDEVMTRLATVHVFVPLCSTWDRLHGKFFAARDRNNCKLTVKQSAISWRLRRQGVDGVMKKLDAVLFFVSLGSSWD